jgi:hypothetical protein
MKLIMTEKQGNLAYWNRATPIAAPDRAFRMGTRFTKENVRSFARLSAFAANGNHAPKGCDGAITSDLAIEFLYKVAGGWQ